MAACFQRIIFAKHLWKYCGWKRHINIQFRGKKPKDFDWKFLFSVVIYSYIFDLLVFARRKIAKNSFTLFCIIPKCPLRIICAIKIAVACLKWNMNQIRKMCHPFDARVKRILNAFFSLFKYVCKIWNNICKIFFAICWIIFCYCVSSNFSGSLSLPTSIAFSECVYVV